MGARVKIFNDEKEFLGEGVVVQVFRRPMQTRKGFKLLCDVRVINTIKKMDPVFYGYWVSFPAGHKYGYLFPKRGDAYYRKYK